MKKNNHLQLCVILFIATWQLSSCVPATIIDDPYNVPEARQQKNIYYVPSAPAGPLLSKKDDLNFNLLRSSSAETSGIEMQAAYIPATHMGVMAGYHSSRNTDGSPDYMRYSRTEAGIGYILPFEEGWHFETYAGGGGGRVKNLHHTGYSDMKLTHFFVQPAIGYHGKKENLQLGLVSRFAMVNFDIADATFDKLREPFSADQLQRIADKPGHFLWEPAFTGRAGWKNFLFTINYAYSVDFSDSDLYRSDDNFSFGISLKLNTRESGKKSSRSSR